VCSTAQLLSEKLYLKKKDKNPKTKKNAEKKDEPMLQMHLNKEQS